MFSLELLQAINNWQRGGDARQNRKRGERLKKVAVNLPQKFRETNLICFRQVALLKGAVWDLIGDDKLDEKISSWTLDLGFAKQFKNGVPPKEAGYQGLIFAIRPPQASVIVNLHALYADSGFVEAIEANQGRIDGYCDGIGKYGDEQNEVVLEIASIAQSDIQLLGGAFERQR